MAIDREAPAKVVNLRGAWSGPDVVLSWDASPEGDVLGYSAYRLDDAREAAVSSCAATAETRCTYRPPAGAGTRYFVRALDRDAGGDLRPGVASDTIDIGPQPGTGLTEANVPPSAPAPLVKKVFGQKVALSWNASIDLNVGDAVAAYRIYRDGTLYASVTGTQLTYTDQNAGKVARVYWVTAVDRRGAESIPAYQPGYTL
jgi:hypothetical protein